MVFGDGSDHFGSKAHRLTLQFLQEAEPVTSTVAPSSSNHDSAKSFLVRFITEQDEHHGGYWDPNHSLIVNGSGILINLILLSLLSMFSGYMFIVLSAVGRID